MPGLTDVLTLIETLSGWAAILTDELLLGGAIGVGLMVWIWKGRDSAKDPAGPVPTEEAHPGVALR